MEEFVIGLDRSQRDADQEVLKEVSWSEDDWTAMLKYIIDLSGCLCLLQR